jgi:hypothetical protein
VNVLDLFSGIGGFSLGLERAGMRTVAFCEVNEWCRRLLKKHWPSVPILKDVTKLGIEPMSSWEDSPAKTLATQADAPALPDHVPLYGGGYAEPFAWFDQSTLSWRTWQRCLVTGWTLFAETWPRSGMTRNGIAYRHPTLVPLTDETASGLWQTPVADDSVDRTAGKFNSQGEPKLSAQVKLWPTPRSTELKGNGYQAKGDAAWPTLTGAVRLWPTPTAVTNTGGAALCKWGGGRIAREIAINGDFGRTQWSTEPDVGRVAHGVPARVDRLCGLGNAVVPQIPEIIGRAIMRQGRL